ncbi:F-box protein At4g22390-like isoform X2 [Salvia hispanica]|uniref:F-box protein At4g22390-like isoform X2 n=1 Tax=Salvia hispanica TaxID=49212 RepID=UPI002009BA78|nr:F-box protein At4g22390-like isoform X2 [Salvia hispanica]
MAFRLALSAARRLPLCNCSLVRSTIYYSVPRSQFVSRVVDSARIVDTWNDGTQFGYKTEFTSAGIYSEPERKPDIFVHYPNKNRDDDLCGHFGAYFVEEDGTLTMSPKYNIYPPSFLLERYFFMTTCYALFYFHSPTLGHALWNPTTCEYKLLPVPYAESPPCPIYEFVACGMWYYNRLGDCKVVNLVRAYLEDERGYLIPAAYHIELYSIKTNSWKRIPCQGWPRSLHQTSHAYISGILYCVTYHVILSFNTSTETFSSLPLPDQWFYGGHILEYKGFLSALVSTQHGNYQLWTMRCRFRLWSREIVFDIPTYKPFCFSNDGKLLYLESSLHGLFMFDCVTRKLKHLGVNSPMSYPKLFPFVENFVQLNGSFKGETRK